MNRRLIFVSTFSAVLMMSLVAFGQPGGGQGGRGGRMGGMGGMMGSGMLLRQEAVLKELSLTDEQKTKLKEALPEGRGPGGGGGQNFRDMSEEERAKAMEERAKQAAETEKKIAEILDEKQNARLKQIRLQVTGARAITIKEVAEELGITEEQSTKIREAMTALREEMMSGGGGGPGAFAEMAEKMNAKLMEQLTDEQKAKYKEMLGETFDVSQIQMGFGGGAGSGGRRGGRGN
jgi:Spy/CpxP family protein refolding chaperone